VSLSMLLLNEFLSYSAWLKRGQFDEKVRMWILQQFIEILDMTQQVVWFKDNQELTWHPCWWLERLGPSCANRSSMSGSRNSSTQQPTCRAVSVYKGLLVRKWLKLQDHKKACKLLEKGQNNSPMPGTIRSHVNDVEMQRNSLGTHAT
jgi:hypothetical protein